MGFLLGAAVLAIGIAIPDSSKGEVVNSLVPAVPATVTTSISAHTAGQGLTRSAVALGGFTSQGWPVVFELGRGGKLVTLVGAGLDLTCTSGNQFSLEDGWQLVGIAKNGKVNTAEQIPPAGSALTGGSHSLTGRFNRQRSTFRGVWSLQLNFKLADGTTDQCQSGKVKLIATL
jgi:hypothetical protein